MPSTLPIDTLRTFLTIADCGSFSQAARRINRTQSAVSMQMKRLEEVIGKSLLNRDGKSSTLTTEGETLVGYARQIIKLNEEAVSRLKQPELTGAVRIGLPDDYAARFLPSILAGFSRTYPQVQVEVTCLSSANLIPLIENNKLDLALTTTSEPFHDEARLLRREPTVWTTSKNHLTHEIRPLPLALFPNDCYFRRWATRALEQAGIEYRIAYTSASIMGLIAAVSAGLAITVMSRSILPTGLKIITEGSVFPKLPDATIFLHRNPNSENLAVDSLGEHIERGFRTEI